MPVKLVWVGMAEQAAFRLYHWMELCRDGRRTGCGQTCIVCITRLFGVCVVEVLEMDSGFWDLAGAFPKALDVLK